MLMMFNVFGVLTSRKQVSGSDISRMIRAKTPSDEHIHTHVTGSFKVQ